MICKGRILWQVLCYMLDFHYLIYPYNNTFFTPIKIQSISITPKSSFMIQHILNYFLLDLLGGELKMTLWALHFLSALHWK